MLKVIESICAHPRGPHPVANILSKIIAFKRAGLEVVSAPKGKRPDRSDRQTATFRGSWAFYNPAALFNVLGTQYTTVKAAVKAGDKVLVVANFPSMVAELFPIVQL